MKGNTVNDLRNFQTNWNRCLMDFGETDKPNDTTLQPMYETQIKFNAAFQATFATLRAMCLVDEEKTYSKLYAMVKKFLDQAQVDANDNASSAVKAPGWAMASFQPQGKGKGKDKGPVWKKGDCANLFYGGQCKEKSCSYSHDNTTTHEQRKGFGKGKKKGKGKGKKGEGKGKKGKSKGKGKDTRECYYCGYTGHLQAACHKNPANTAKGGKGKKGKGKDGKGKSKGSDRASSWNPPPRTGKSPSGKEAQPPCRLAKTGVCQYGDTCKFWHPPVCKHWRKGECALGSACDFTHAEYEKRGGKNTPRGHGAAMVAEDAKKPAV